MRGKRSAQSSVIGVRAQLREYSRRTRRPDDAQCLLLVCIGLEARLLLCFSAKANASDDQEIELSSLFCARCCERNKEEGLVRGRHQRLGAPGLSFSGMFVRGVQAVQTQG